MFNDFSLPTFPIVRFHPVYGRREANSTEEALKVFTGDLTDWFPTAAAADVARTDREAALAIHNTRRDVLSGVAPEGTVRFSATNDEYVKVVEAQAEAAKEVAEADVGRVPDADALAAAAPSDPTANAKVKGPVTRRTS